MAIPFFLAAGSYIFYHRMISSGVSKDNPYGYKKDAAYQNDQANLTGQLVSS
jgi:hypothetical protein